MEARTMNSPRQSIDMSKAMSDPASMFAKPHDVIDAPSLSHSQKLAILEQWEHQARLLAVAEEEGMTGGEESMLGRVRRAITALRGEDEDEERPVVSTKAF
jgi:hypothetical protein